MSTTCISLQKTCGNNPEQITIQNIRFFEVNIHVSGNNVKYGNGVITDAEISVGGVATFRSDGTSLLSDIFVKNAVADAVGVVTIVATIPEV